MLKKESADEGWWEGENLTTNITGVFPKNFLDQAPIAAPGNAGPTAVGQRNKTVVMRETNPDKKQVRRNIQSEIPTSSTNMVRAQKL